MGEDQTQVRLSRTVAEAADAWLTDPLDVGVYERLVRATLNWRSYTHPVLEGTEHAGRRDPVAPTAANDDTPPGRAPAPVADIIGSDKDPRALLSSLRGALPSAAGEPADQPSVGKGTSP